MKKIGIVIVAVAVNASCAIGQTDDVKKYLRTLPNISLTEKEPQKYKITTDYFNGNILGNFINKTRVTGNYTRGFADGTVKWNSVTIANGSNREGPFETAASQDYMENFTYTPSAKMIEASSFAAFPPNSFHTKNLVWDMLAIEHFSWNHFDSMKLNKTFRPANKESEISLAGEGTFQNKDVQLTWIGISEMNNELCALIEYRTLDNPLRVENEQLKIKGRSHYWGTIWVSMMDKQIEHATLYEDVIMDLQFAKQASQMMNSTRIITFEKLN